MQLTYKWFYGRDLRNLTDEELQTAYKHFGKKPKPKSDLAKAGLANFMREYNRRFSLSSFYNY